MRLGSNCSVLVATFPVERDGRISQGCPVSPHFGAYHWYQHRFPKPELRRLLAVLQRAYHWNQHRYLKPELRRLLLLLLLLLLLMMLLLQGLAASHVEVHQLWEPSDRSENSTLRRRQC